MEWETLFANRASRMSASEIRELLKLLEQPDIISFAGGVPDAALFPAEDFKNAYADIFATEKSNEALQYSVSEGYIPLRRWIVQEMSALGIPCGLDNILITSGSQQALDFIGKLFLTIGDTVLLTWPTYLGALGAFNAYEPEYARLNLDSKQSTSQSAERTKAAYVSVDFANPTGKTLPQADRENILDLADTHNFAIIEDAAYQALRYDGEPVPPILATEIDRKGNIEATRTLYCGSFSKTLTPGLRVGWVCAATPVISQLVLIKQAADLHSSTINQMAIAEVAAQSFEHQVTKIRETYQQRRNQMLKSLETHMPPGVQWTKPEGGMFIWLTLPKNIDGKLLLADALSTQKVAFVPGQAFFPDGSGANTMRLSFSAVDETKIDRGIKRLGKLLCAAIADGS
jgi:hypothetical protein